MPWVALDDVIEIMHRSLSDNRCTGAIKVVAPGRITNAEFTKELASTLHRPAIIPIPAVALKLALGKQMADETLLVDLDVAPAKLESLSYPFRFPKIGGALAS